MTRGCLEHGAILRAVGIAAAHGRIGEGGHDRPAFHGCTLAAVAELVLDAGGPLQVRAETRVESGFHFCDSICSRDTRSGRLAGLALTPRPILATTVSIINTVISRQRRVTI